MPSVRLFQTDKILDIPLIHERGSIEKQNDMFGGIFYYRQIFLYKRLDSKM